MCGLNAFLAYAAGTRRRLKGEAGSRHLKDPRRSFVALSALPPLLGLVLGVLLASTMLRLRPQPALPLAVVESRPADAGDRHLKSRRRSIAPSSLPALLRLLLMLLMLEGQPKDAPAVDTTRSLSGASSCEPAAAAPAAGCGWEACASIAARSWSWAASEKSKPPCPNPSQ